MTWAKGLKPGDCVTHKGEAAVVVWVQPEGWMETFDGSFFFAGGWHGRLDKIGLADHHARFPNADARPAPRWTSTSRNLHADRPRLIVRYEARSKRASQGIAAGAVRYGWVTATSVTAIKASADG